MCGRPCLAISTIRWWQLKYLFGIFTPMRGEMIQFDLRIFVRWVGEKPPTSILTWPMAKL